MERPDRKEFVAGEEQDPLFAVHWTAGIGRPAAIFWFEGQVLLAGIGTRAEAWLLERGAIEVGMLRFGGPGGEGERAVPGGEVVPVLAGEMVEDVSARLGRRN